MKNIIYRCAGILCIIVVFLSLCNCDNDLVERPKGLTDPGSFYRSADQVELVFSYTLDLFYNSWSGRWPWELAVTFIHSDQVRQGHLVIAENTGQDMWKTCYKAIMNLNHVIESINEGRIENESDERIQELLAMAKCLRAWNYHTLVQMYGDIPIYTENTDDYFSYLPERSPVSEVYELIVEDYLFAVDNLPSSPRQIAHPNKEVAKALLVKAYISMASFPLKDETKWQKAADLSWEIIQEGEYSLVEDINKVFSVETEDGPEMMWSFVANSKDSGIHPQVWSTMDGWGDIGVDLVWAERFPEQPRKEAYLEIHSTLTGDHYIDLGSYPGVKKFLYAGDFNRGYSESNYPVMRFADVLLMYAEASNNVNNGPTDQAVWAVNQTIDRANGYEPNPDYPLATSEMSFEEFDRLVIDERNWELCFEMADRWFDLVRKRIILDYVREEDKKNFSEDDYLYPIPEQDLRVNSNLTQNPGYPDYR